MKKTAFIENSCPSRILLDKFSNYEKNNFILHLVMTLLNSRAQSVVVNGLHLAGRLSLATFLGQSYSLFLSMIWMQQWRVSSASLLILNWLSWLPDSLNWWYNWLPGGIRGHAEESRLEHGVIIHDMKFNKRKWCTWGKVILDTGTGWDMVD